MKSGIYKIICKENGKIYIGQSKNINPRLRQHWFELKNRRHGNEYFQNLYDKYGKDGFLVEIIEFCNVEDLDDREGFYIDLYKSYEKDIGFNIHKFPDYKRSVNYKWNDSEFRKKISSNAKKRWEDPEFRKRNEEAIRKAHNERKARGEVLAIATPEAIEKSRKRQQDAWKDEEYRKGMIEKLKKTTNSEEYKNARAADAKRGWEMGRREGVDSHNEFQKTNEEYKRKQAEKTKLSWIKRRQKKGIDDQQPCFD